MKPMNYLVYLRPVFLIIFLFHMVIGLVAGLLLFPGTRLDNLAFLIGVLAWAILLNGGTLALNSYYDKDEHDVAWLKAPSTLPKYLNLFGLALMLLGWAISYLINMGFFLAYSVCFILSILYSAPPFRFKSKLGLDVLINAIGYGALTFYAGYALLDLPLTPQILAVISLIFLSFLQAVPYTQIYQIQEDKRNGNRTIAVVFGKKQAINFSILMFVMGLALSIIYFFNSWINICPILPLFVYNAYFLLNWRLKYQTIDDKTNMYKSYVLLPIGDVSFIASILFM